MQLANNTILTAILSFLLPAVALSADESTVAATYRAKDTLAEVHDLSADARACLVRLVWKPNEFDVTCSTEPLTLYDFLVRFPTPAPSGDAVNDLVTMEWYAARDSDGNKIKAPAVLVVHESGQKMPVGRLFAYSLRDKGLHAFLIHLPYYAKRRNGDSQPNGHHFVELVRQAIADVRRAHDAIAVLPEVDAPHIAIQGTSLGGFVAALGASLDDSFAAVFIMLAGGNLHDLISKGERDTANIRTALAKEGFTGKKLKETLWQIDPIRVAHRLDPTRTWLYSAENDRVVPIENALALAEAAGLDEKHHVKVAAGHYTAIVHLPTILDHMVDQIRECRAESGLRRTESNSSRPIVQPTGKSYPREN